VVAVPRYRPVAAAFALGLAALRTGQDIRDAVEAAGYSKQLAESTYNKIMSQRRSTLPIMDAPIPGPVKRYVKTCMDNVVELQSVVYALGSVVAGTAGTITALGLQSIIQGSADGTRKGDVIHVSSFQMKGVCLTGTTGGIIRIVIFRDLQSNGATPAVTDILSSASYIAMYNVSNVTKVGGARFKILYDRVYVQNLNIAATAYFDYLEYSNSGKFMTTYISNSGTSASVGTNNVWMLSIADNANSQSNVTTQFMYRDG